MVGSGGRGVALLAWLLSGCLWQNPAYVEPGTTGPQAATSEAGSDASTSAGTGAVTAGSGTGESASSGGATGTAGGTASGSTGGSTGTGGSGCLLTNPCDEDADCLDQGGSIACVCRPGFLGDGYTCVLAATLMPLHWEIPCAAQDCSSRACETGQMAKSDAQTLVGEAGVIYDVTLRIRGVVEEKEYSGGTKDGFWCDGGAPTNDSFNQMSLEVSDPPQKYWINSGAADVSNCVALDYSRTIPVKAGALVSLGVADTNACQIFNQDSPGGDPLQIADIPTVAQPFDGQFVYVEATNLALK